MKKLLIVLFLMIKCLVSYHLSSYNQWFMKSNSKSNIERYAKVKSLISDELLKSLDNDLNVGNKKSEASVAKSKTKEKKEKKNKLKSDSILPNSDNEEEPEKNILIDDSTRKNELKQKRERKKSPSLHLKFSKRMSIAPGTLQLDVDKVGFSIGDSNILKDCSFHLSPNDRIGLVGPNGSGKTSLLKIIMGLVDSNSGSVKFSPSNAKVSILRQEFVDQINHNNSLYEELSNSLEEEKTILNQIKLIEEIIASSVDDPQRMDDFITQLNDIQDLAHQKGVYKLDSKVRRIADMIGFKPTDLEMPVHGFSGGWKMRIGLSKLLLQEPDILLLDEPTNHMDLDSVIWLEHFLVRQKLPMIIVSHDREFLDRVCNKIVDIEEGTTISYQCRYSEFIERREERMFTWRDRFEKQQRFIRDEEKWIRSHINDPKQATNVRNKQMGLEKLRASDDYIQPPPKEKKFFFRFPEPPRCSHLVLEARGLSHGYEKELEKQSTSFSTTLSNPSATIDNCDIHQYLFSNVDFDISKGDRIGLVGPNGSGKSTLMRLLLGSELPIKGTVEYQGSNVVVGYYSQNQADYLEGFKTVLETVQDASQSSISQTDIRTLLSKFMFKGDNVYKKIESLSGGEKSRVALCKMLLRPSNLLLLDEPTNHLDITSKEVLETALAHFAGAVIVISHDRYFMSQVANTIFELKDNTLNRFDGDYYSYLINHDANQDLRSKVESRYLPNGKYKIKPAIQVDMDTKLTKLKKKNFGGSGVTSGKTMKGIKNAKRFR